MNILDKFFFAFLMLVVCSLQGHVPKQYTAEQFLNTKKFVGGTFTADEKRVLFSSNQSGVFNVYSLAVDGSDIKQLTTSDNHARTILTNFPFDDRFLFLSDGLGNELDHIWLQESNGSMRDLTPYPEAKFDFNGWSQDGLSFFYSSNQRNAKFMDLYEMDAVALTSTLFFQNDSGWIYGDMSPDKQYLSMIKYRTANDNDLFIFNFETKQLQKITTHTGDILSYPACFSRDSKELYFVTDQDSNFKYLRKINLETKKIETVAQYEWDISNFSTSFTGRFHVTTINQDGKQVIEIYDQLEAKKLPLPQFPEGEITGVKISRSEKAMLLHVNGCNSPTNLFIYNFEKQSSLQLTQSLNSEIDSLDLVTAEIIRYPSYDGLPIPALLYRPHGIAAGEKVPAIIYVHGGPGGQSSVGYKSLFQYLVNHGYAIIAVNNRGSSGYGKSFFKAADLKHGESDLDDCMAAKKFLVASGISEPNKIGIMGGSYGGYMTLAALAFRPDEMAVGVDIFGVSNWIRTLKSIPAWWESEREVLYQKIGDPEKDAEYLKSISPLFHADKIKKPLLVVQGANDPRVLQVESDQIVDAVTGNNIPCEYVLFEDEGHGFAKKKNERIALEKILQFLELHLPLKNEVQ